MVEKSDESFDNTLIVLLELDRTLSDILNAESSQRGYLITGNDAYLKPYYDTLPSIQQHLKTLASLTKDNRPQHERLQQLEQKIQARIARMNQGITLYQTQDFAAVQTFMSDGTGKALMDDIREVTADMIQAENKTQAERKERITANYQTLYTTAALANAANLFLIFFTFYLTYKELKKRNEEERHKDEFINMASHELKTPITSMKIFTHVLEKKLKEGQPDDAKRYIAKIDGQTNKLTLLISDLLDLSRIQTGKMRFEKEVFNLDALIDETIEEVQGTTKKHTIKTEGNINRLINADRYRMYQVLVNMLTNAVKYSPEGGKILVRSKVENKKAIVSVKDQGIGIDAKYQKKIFDRLYQVTDAKEKTYPGLGVGLYISAHIIKMHKGEMWVDSEKGKGSTFSFSLPLEQDAA